METCYRACLRARRSLHAVSGLVGIRSSGRTGWSGIWRFCFGFRIYERIMDVSAVLQGEASFIVVVF